MRPSQHVPFAVSECSLEVIVGLVLCQRGHSLMLSDGRCAGKPNFQGFSLSLTAKTDKEAEKLFKALGQGGVVQMPMASTFFASRFGMVADKFGVGWMVLTEAPAKK